MLASSSISLRSVASSHPWQFGARCPPSIQPVVIATVWFCHPFKKIQNQDLHHEIGHGFARSRILTSDRGDDVTWFI